MITFRLVADQRPDAGSGAGEQREAPPGSPADPQAQRALWPEPRPAGEVPAAPRAPMPRYRRIGE